MNSVGKVSTLLATATLLLAVPLDPAAAQTPLDHAMQVAVTFKPLDVSAFQDGKLPPGASATYAVTATVTYPQLSVCLTVVTVTFKLVPKTPALANGVISPSSVTQSPDFTSGGTPAGPAQSIVGLFGGKQDFKTTLSVRAEPDAAPDSQAQFDVKANAVAGTTSQGNCNLGAGSNTGTLSFVIGGGKENCKKSDACGSDTQVLSGGAESHNAPGFDGVLPVAALGSALVGAALRRRR